MNFYVQQSITIHFLKVNSVTNSSVLQIGSAGIIKPVSHLMNTGGFSGPAPEIKKPGQVIDTDIPSSVRLTPPVD